MIQRANMMVTRVWLHSFHEVILFCNRSDALCKTNNHRTVEPFYKNGTKTEWNVNVILSHTVLTQTSETYPSTILTFYITFWVLADNKLTAIFQVHYWVRCDFSTIIQSPDIWPSFYIVQFIYQKLFHITKWLHNHLSCAVPAFYATHSLYTAQLESAEQWGDHCELLSRWLWNPPAGRNI